MQIEITNSDYYSNGISTLMYCRCLSAGDQQL